MNQVLKFLRKIGEAGKNADGSYTRTCYSPEYFQATAIVEEEMQKLGMQINQDAAGNIHGVLPGKEREAGSIIIGSHLDTVPEGGLYDGAYGVAAGLEVIRRFTFKGVQTRHSIEIYGFNAEESNPIGGTFGSRAIAGLVNPMQAGLSEELKKYGRTVEEILKCKRIFSPRDRYLELHIEQGDRLETDSIQIGIVSGIVGIVRYRVAAIGQSNHAGTTMMKNRKDALVAMSQLIVAADQKCREIDDKLVFTVGRIHCRPNSENVIPGVVTCTFEMRHMDHSKTDALIAFVKEKTKQINTVEFSIEKIIDKDSVACDENLMQVISQVAEENSVSHVIIPSGAGHDANPIAHRIPVGMIFVPSHNGLSHCKEEYTNPKSLEIGAEILFQTVCHLDDSMNLEENV